MAAWYYGTILSTRPHPHVHEGASNLSVPAEKRSSRNDSRQTVISHGDGSDWWRYSVFIVGGIVESGNSTGGLVGGVEIEHE